LMSGCRDGSSRCTMSLARVNRFDWMKLRDIGLRVEAPVGVTLVALKKLTSAESSNSRIGSWGWTAQKPHQHDDADAAFTFSFGGRRERSWGPPLKRAYRSRVNRTSERRSRSLSSPSPWELGSSVAHSPCHFRRWLVLASAAILELLVLASAGEARARCKYGQI
jgi:hypothetical protein